MVPSSFTRKFVIVLAVVVCVAYLVYRVNWTFNTSGPYAYTASLLLFVAECFGILNLFLFFLQVWDVSEPPAQPVLEGRTVDVFVPTLDEDVALLRATLEACVRMDYPHKTYVLDDGRRPEVEKLARDLGIHYLARPDNRHFKAGNLNHAFERTDGEFVVVLDADHVPEPHFITRLIGYFADDRLGYVQTPHAFYNFDSFQARLDHASRKYWEEGHLFHHVVQPGRNRWGCPIFAGSAAMFRRSAIRDVGLMATETITEDLHTGLRMNARGWRSLAITERLVAGEAAPDITTYHAQRLRWGTGNLSVLRYDNPLAVGGLSLAQRVCYVGSMLHWATGLFKLVIYLTPIAMLFSGVPPVKEFTWELLWVTVVYLIVSLTAMKIVSNGYGSIVNAELFAMVNFWTQIRATSRALLGYGTRHFQVTPKGPVVRERRRVIWPFIRPQTYLIILSVLALFWGWSRPVLEVSDDWFTPVVPTVWVLFHFWLAYKVTQRAFWPTDRRVTRRHVVHVPIEYETLAGGAPPRYGVTIDLNDQGMAFVAYEKFGPGDVLRFTVRGAGETVRCKGEIRSVTDLTRGEEADGFRYGILFLNATDPQMDALNRICLHYGVPRLYGEYDRRRGGLLGALQQQLDRGLAQRRRERRNRYRLPIVVNSGETEDTVQFSATEDLSRSAVAALLDHGLPKDTPVGYLLATPIGEVRGAARVLRTSPEVYAGRTYYRTVMEFADFEGQGRTTLNSLVNPHEAGPLRAALKPDRKPILVQMAGATFVAILIALPLIVLQSGIFRYYHQDDYVLRDIHAKAVRQEPLTPEDAAEVERVFRATMADRNPTSDRLVLLMNALKVYGRRQDQLTVAEQLAGRNTNDLGLQQALIYAQLRAGCYTDAEATFVRLQEQANSGHLDAEQTRQFRLAGARVAEGRGDLDRALERYRELYDENPDYIAATERPNGTPVRREFAGVLLKAGRFDEAKEVLQSARTDDLEAQRMRVAAHLLKGRAVATDPAVPDARRKDNEAREYDGAERAVKDLADCADQKQDAALKDAAERMRADVYMARHSWTMAREIMDKMAAVHGENDPDLVRRLAQAQLGLGDYAGALNGFATLLANDRVSGALKGDVIRGFLDAAAHPTVTPGDREREIALGKVFEGGLACIENDPIYLARFGWVLQRVRRPEESRQVLEKASQKHPSNPEVRNQLANILIQTGNDEQAAALLAESNPFRARQTKASSLMRRGDWTGAEAELRKAAAEFPGGFRNPDGYVVTADDVRRTELLLGTALGLESLQHPPDRPDAFPAAIAHYQGLQMKYPSDPEVTVALGNMYLWSAERTADPARRQEEYATALKHFHKVLADKTWTPDADGPASRSKVEQGFIDAAASAPSLHPAEAAIAKEIAARRANGPALEPIPAARLAWVLIKTQDAEARRQGIDLIRRAADGPLKDDERRELAGVLGAAHEFKLAAELLTPVRKDLADTIRLASLFTGAHQWDLARAELGRVVRDASATPEQKRAAGRELAKVTAYAGRHADALRQLADLLKQDPDDLELRVFQAEVNVWANHPDEALSLFVPLVKQHPENALVGTGFAEAAAKSQAPLSDEARAQLLRLTERAAAPENRDPLLLARVAEAHAAKLGGASRARELARKAAAMDPKDPAVRREVAYVLAHPRIGLFKEADALFAGVELAGEERKRYVFIASQAENYEAARRQARLYLSEQQPGSLQEREARRLLADVLMWKGDYEEALAIYERLSAEQKTDRDLRIDIAQVYRYAQNYPVALAKFAELLGEDIETRSLWTGFIDAASSAPRIEHQKDLVLRVYDRIAPEIDDVRAMSRLAWGLLRLNEPAKADLLLARALAANPEQPAVRKELAGVLAAAGRRAEAIEMLTHSSVLTTLDVTELLNLTDLLTAEDQLEKAEDALAKVVTDASDRASRVRYASVLLWNGRYAKAQDVLDRLDRDFPHDREVLVLTAQSYLWSKDYPNALRRFTDLVAAGPEADANEEPLANVDIWRGYVDSAAGLAREPLRAEPRPDIGGLLTTAQRTAIFEAFAHLTTVRDRVTGQNKAEMDRLIAGRGESDPTFDARRKVLQARHDARMKGLGESMGRLGLLLGFLGDRDKSRASFDAALAIDRQNRGIWLRYAQALTALGDDLRAKSVYDWLLANPAQKSVVPAGFEGQ